MLATLSIALCAQAPPADNAGALLTARARALVAMGVHDPQTLQTSGSLDGLSLHGTFHSWQAGDDERYDQHLGVQNTRELQTGGKQYVVNASGDVRELDGSLARRQRTFDFIYSPSFDAQPQYSAWLGVQKLPDGRAVEQLRVTPPGGDPQTVSIDDATHMIDRIAFVEGDGVETQTYSDYRVVDGALIAYRETDSNGDVRFDQTSIVKDVAVNRPIDAAVFAVPQSVTVQTDAPITLPISTRDGHVVVPVTIRGRTFRMLLDTGSQGVVLDREVARDLTLLPVGMLEIRGATRSSGDGFAALDSLQIGGATLPVGVAALVDLGSSTRGSSAFDGVLGYPFFAAAEVRLDFARGTMTFGKPGSLPPLGEKIALDTDRQLPEATVEVNRFSTQALVDTGDGIELLLFRSFTDAHPGAVSLLDGVRSRNYGVGGSMDVVSLTVDELDIGSFRLFNRHANVMLPTSGAFADRIDGANVGLPTLENFIVTFDLANHAMYLARGSAFDDGRARSQ